MGDSNNGSPSTPASLDDASTVAIVIHGIGDQSSYDILTCARQGYLRLQPQDAAIDEVPLDGWPVPTGQYGPLRALKIVANGKTHYVIPIVWAHLRQRATDSFNTILRSVQVQQRVALALAVVVFSWGSLFRCIFRTRTLGWALAISGFTLLTIAMTLATFFISIALFVSLAYTSGALDTPRMFHWWQSGLTVIGLLAISWVMVRVMRVFDFIGDVASYVSDDDRRSQLHTILERVVSAVASGAPNSKIVLAGHSLGSVAAADVAATLSAPSLARRLVLLTLGSPLKRMNDVFPAIVRSPQYVATYGASNGCLLYWVNLWRDGDFVGRDLGPIEGARFLETSLGQGPHWNMWSDPRAWMALVELLQVSDAARLTELKGKWDIENPVPWPQSRAEIYGIAFRLWGRRIVFFPMMTFFLGRVVYYGPAGNWLQFFGPWVSVGVGAAWLLAATLLVAVLFYSVVPADTTKRRDTTGTQFSALYVGAMRRAAARSDLVFNASVASALGFYAVLYWATQYH